MTELQGDRTAVPSVEPAATSPVALVPEGKESEPVQATTGENLLSEGQEPSVLQTNEDWLAVFDQLSLTPWAASQLRTLCLLRREGTRLVFGVLPRVRPFLDADIQLALRHEVSRITGIMPELAFEEQDPLPLDNVTCRREALQQQKLQQTLAGLQADPGVHLLQQGFQAWLDESSIRPAASPSD